MSEGLRILGHEIISPHPELGPQARVTLSERIDTAVMKTTTGDGQAMETWITHLPGAQSETPYFLFETVSGDEVLSEIAQAPKQTEPLIQARVPNFAGWTGLTDTAELLRAGVITVEPDSLLVAYKKTGTDQHPDMLSQVKQLEIGYTSGLTVDLRRYEGFASPTAGKDNQGRLPSQTLLAEAIIEDGLDSEPRRIAGPDINFAVEQRVGGIVVTYNNGSSLELIGFGPVDYIDEHRLAIA